MRGAGRALILGLGLLVVVASVRGLWIAAAGPSSAGAAWDDRTAAQLRFLSSTDREGEAMLPVRADAMQELFPEGRLFTLALTGLAWRNLGERQPMHKERAQEEVALALSWAEDERTRRTFGPAGGLPHGMFYEAWTTHLRLASSRTDGRHRAAGAAACERLNAALSGPVLFPDSYPGAAWPADAVVGAAALHRCGAYDARHARAARRWLDRVGDRLDPATGLIPHDAVRLEARGSSSALMIPFLTEIDPSFARDQYERFEAAFGTRTLGVAPAVREFPHGREGGGDVDSGPVVLGVSAPASVVGIAAARAAGDASEAEALRATVEALGVPLAWRGERSYALGRLPVGDAFLAWAASVPLTTPSPSARPWRLRWVLAHLGLLALGLWGLRRNLARRSPRRPA